MNAYTYTEINSPLNTEAYAQSEEKKEVEIEGEEVGSGLKQRKGLDKQTIK